MVQKMTRLIAMSAIPPVTGLDSISADDRTKKMIAEAAMNETREKTVQAYVEGLKRKIKVKINTELL
jgi:ABC-type Na+ transport system ATPase subunit NatA